MRYVYLLATVLLLSACGSRSVEVVEYQQVLVTPTCSDCMGIGASYGDVTVSEKVEYY